MKQQCTKTKIYYFYTIEKKLKLADSFEILFPNKIS